MMMDGETDNTAAIFPSEKPTDLSTCPCKSCYDSAIIAD